MEKGEIMTTDIQQVIDTAKLFSEVRFEGEINLELPKSACFYVGKNFSKSLVTITKPNITLDFSDAIVRVNIAEPLDTDLNIFFVSSMAKNVEIKNLKLYVYLNIPVTSRQIVGIYNTAYGLKLNNCDIEIVSENQSNLVGMFNNGNLDTHMETRADNLVIANSCIKVQIVQSGMKDSVVYGVYNNLANSISIQNTFVYSTNIGFGKKQAAIGVFTNGRFGRFIGCNIKANGSHNTGNLKEQAYAYGFVNEGLYNLIESNNIIGEWGGQCVGLENKGDFAKVSGNKILATHTIKGRSVRNYANDSIFDGNILTSTSRNPRLFEQEGSNCIITNNMMEGLQLPQTYRSSVGIYAAAESAAENLISQNIIKNVCDCGIFAHKNIGFVQNNIITTYAESYGFIKLATTENSAIANKLDENRIHSILD